MPYSVCKAKWFCHVIQYKAASLRQRHKRCKLKKGSNTKKDTVMVFTITITSIISCILTDISLFWGFLFAIVFSYNLFRRRGFSSTALLDMVKFGLWECRMLYVLIVLIGATMSIWLSSGTVPAMIYYGLDYMKGVNFLFAAFIIRKHN